MLLYISVNKGYCIHQILHSPPAMYLDVLRMRKHRMLAPESWGTHPANDFSEPRFLHLPTHGKVLISLTWGNWFSFVNNNLLMLKLPDFSCKNSYIILAPHLTSLEQSLRVIWEAIFWAWRPKNDHRIKRNSQILGCVFFFNLKLQITVVLKQH